jgi:hypothetical protein
VDANADGDETSVMLIEDIELGTEVAAYEFDFSLRAASGYGEGVKVPFIFIILAGGSETPFELSNVVVKATARHVERIQAFDSGLVANGGFEANFNFWDPWTEGPEGARARWSIDRGAAKMEPLVPGSEDWHLQLMSRKSILFKAGARYKLSFDAWSTTGRVLRVRLGERGRDMDGDGQRWGGYAFFSATIGAARARYSFEFDMKDFDDDDAALAFNLGGASESVWIDDVALEELNRP